MRTLWLGSGIVAVAFVAMTCLLGSSYDEWQQDNDRELRQDLRAFEELTRKRAQMVEELVAGRRSLFEAAAFFRALSEQSSIDLLHYLRMFHPGRSDEELYYLHVLMHVEGNCRYHGGNVAILESLRQEFETRRLSGTLTVDSPGGCPASPSPEAPLPRSPTPSSKRGC